MTHSPGVCLCGVLARQDDTLTWFMFVCVVCRPGKVTHSPDVFVSLQASGMTKRRPGKVTHSPDVFVSLQASSMMKRRR